MREMGLTVSTIEFIQSHQTHTLAPSTHLSILLSLLFPQPVLGSRRPNSMDQSQSGSHALQELSLHPPPGGQGSTDGVRVFGRTSRIVNVEKAIFDGEAWAKRLAVRLRGPSVA